MFTDDFTWRFDKKIEQDIVDKLFDNVLKTKYDNGVGRVEYCASTIKVNVAGYPKKDISIIKKGHTYLNQYQIKFGAYDISIQTDKKVKFIDYENGMVVFILSEDKEYEEEKIIW